jgi:putative DNA modification/repair radical SAM protein
VPILKVLLSNTCTYNCAYCVNRRSANVHRASFQPEELARTIADFDARGVIHGAFISSGVLGTPDDTMDRLIWMARSLRERYGYRGYLHLKVIPGASPELVRLAMRYATRVSVNIELPSEESLLRIAPDKSADAILAPMTTISNQLRELTEKKAKGAPSDSFSAMSAGQTTQLIVGASPESDSVILELAQHLYKSFNVRRVYYSAFRPEGTDSSLPHPDVPPYRREFRLYQADMLFRWYGFEPMELFESRESLDQELDPKTSWALRNVGCFPVELMTADFTRLVRVPGIGPNSARRILELRKAGRLNSSSLRKLRIRLKYASWFITLHGKAPSEDLQFLLGAPQNCTLDHPEILREFLREKEAPPPPVNQELDFRS